MSTVDEFTSIGALPDEDQLARAINAFARELGCDGLDIREFAASLAQGLRWASDTVENNSRHLSNTRLAGKLAELNQRYEDLQRQADRHSAGYSLESVLNELFSLSGLDPREPFRIRGEQIDGLIQLDGEIYLIEAKWEKQPVGESALLAFRGKVEGKSQFTRGVFISISGYSLPGIEAFTQGKSPNCFLLDGEDLQAVLSGGILLCELLRLKFRRLAEEGRVFVPASKL